MNDKDHLVGQLTGEKGSHCNMIFTQAVIFQAKLHCAKNSDPGRQQDRSGKESPGVKQG